MSAEDLVGHTSASRRMLMRRFVTLLGLALCAYALIPGAAPAQVTYVQPRPYIVVAPPPVTSSYVAPSVTKYSPAATYSYYTSTTVYSAPPVVSYPAPV